MSNPKDKFLKNLAEHIRTSTFETILNAGSGHLGACSSSVELLTALYFGGILRYNPQDPKDIARDRAYIRGHVGPLRYKIFSLLDWIEEDELENYRKFGSRLKGHESMHHMPGVDITPSGSLGMLLSYGAGAAYMTKYLGLESKHYVFLGDGEEQEGNISEAARHISSINLENMVCIIDANGKQLSRSTNEVDFSTDIGDVWKGYGWDVLKLKDGHDIQEIIEAYKSVNKNGKPTVIIAQTVKGKGLEGCLDHYSGYHTISTCRKEIVSQAIDERKIEFRLDLNNLKEIVSQISVRPTNLEINSRDLENKRYNINIKINPTNNSNLDDAQGDYLIKLMDLKKTNGMPFFFMTPDLVPKNLVKMINLNQSDGYIDTGIREQHTIAMAHGMSQTNPNARIFINYFDAFLYRASDQLNAAAQGKSNIIVLSETSGLTQGKNGESHQSSGQPSIPLFMPGVDFYEPADVQDLYNVFNHIFSNNPGLIVIRSHKANIKPLERKKEDSNNINYYPVFESDIKPQVSLVGSGYVVGNLVEAAKSLEREHRIGSKVINIINPKSLDEKFSNLIEDGKPLLTGYNGNPNILQSQVALSLMKYSGSRPSKIEGHGFYFGDTGSIEDLTHAYRLDAEGIIKTLFEKFSLK